MMSGGSRILTNAAQATAAGIFSLCALVSLEAAGPPFVDITWMSISNVYYELGSLRILTDGYITRLPQSAFSGGGAGLATPRQPFKPDVVAVTRVLTALGGPASANLAEDFPNGGGNRAFLFVVDGPDGRFSWFFQNSASAADLHVPIVVGGTNYGAPLENLGTALKAEGLESVDLWIGTGGRPIAQGVFLEAFLQQSGVQMVKPLQYMDRWRLDRTGIRSIPNASVKGALGFSR
jgi:hypothetical protein